jgi:superfamily II DNA or RNA helicase
MKAYYGTHLAMPKKWVQGAGGSGNGLSMLKRTLEFPYNETKVKAWSETDTHIVLPREYISVEEYKHLNFQIDNLCPQEYEHIESERTYNLRNVVQEEACAALLSGSGLLVLACGKGKTVISLHAWSILQVPGIVVVPKIDLAHQWRSRILEHTDITEDQIGWIQGNPDNWEWKGKAITIAVLKTSALYAEHFTEEMKRYFGVAIFDEVHRLGAPFFNDVAAITYGRRWGLSATPVRNDGLDQIYRYHLGPVLYENTSQESIPRVYFLESETELKQKDMKSVTSQGEIHFAKLVSWLAEQPSRNLAIIGAIQQARDQGRSILVLSDRVEHLKYLQSQIPESGIIHGTVKGEDREGVLQDNNIVFASTKIAKEGLDKKGLDTVILTTPLSDEGTFVQVMGRAQRSDDPVVVIVEDKISMCRSMCHRLRHMLNVRKYPHYKMRLLLL